MKQFPRANTGKNRHLQIIRPAMHSINDEEEATLTQRGPASSLSILFLILLAELLTGCGTMPNGRGWGQDATLTPGWARIGAAALNAAVAPETWGPAAGALAFQVNDADRKVTKWAARNTPVFGSPERANRMSYDLRDTASALWIASAVAAPSGDNAGDWSIAARVTPPLR